MKIFKLYIYRYLNSIVNCSGRKSVLNPVAIAAKCFAFKTHTQSS